MKSKREKLILFSLIGLGFLIRILLSFFKGFRVDISAWYSWAERLTDLDFAQFYNPNIWTHYTPGYLYILWFLGFFKNIFNIISPILLLQLFKLPNILADIFTAVLIYKIIKNTKAKKKKLNKYIVKKKDKWALVAFGLYLFNPALVFNSSVWGQADSFLSFLIVLAVWLLINKNKIIASSLVYSFSFLVKPQALFTLPLIGLYFLKIKKFFKGLNYLFLALLFALFLSLPFFPQDPFFGLFKLIIQMGRDYTYTSLNAFNLWGLLTGWQQDSGLFLNLSYNIWGLVIFLLWQGILSFVLFKKKAGKKFYYLAGALFLFSFFLFPTRIHERYLLSSLPFLLIAAGLYRSVFLIFNFIILSFIHFVNIFMVYNYYYPDFLKITKIFSSLSFLLSLATIAIFLLLFFFYSGKIKDINFNFKKLKFLFRIKKQSNKWLRVKNKNIYLGIILGFSFIIRVFNVWHPTDYIFDEVYHGFTAQEMAKGNIKAWEWWNPSPEGFAYEWTHPPLAKLIMAGGVLFFCQNNTFSQYAFRFPAILFGLGVIYLTYLIGAVLFKNEKIGLLAAFLVSFDGLLFVMSRIGMADVYFLFFLLLTIYFSLKKKYLLSSLGLGLALATKWTAFYLYPVIILLMVVRFLQEKNKTKLRLKYILGFISYFIIPFFIYLLAYLPFFTFGHSFSQFWELQKQMWWYHINLDAAHNYQSSALTWPFMLRPVWFWVKYQGNEIANIYNLGNPVIWWFGVLILPFLILKSIERFLAFKDVNLGLVVFFYFAFFLPWTFSPRIMFLHHYLPAIPFLTIMIAWFLNKLKDWANGSEKIIYCYLGLAVINFIFLYPLYTGILIPKNLLQYFFWFSSWR
jgi:dolichyl-phosphate-mannose-protein mannosyltransferase